MINKQTAKFNKPIPIDESLKDRLRIFPENLKQHLEDERKVARELVIGNEESDFLSMKQELIDLE